jgi:phosphatidylglycerophosphate synthase
MSTMPSDPTSPTPPYPAAGLPAGTALATGTIGAAAAGLAVQWSADLTPWYALKVTALLPVLGLLVARHRGAATGPADLVTLARAVVTALVLGFVGEPQAQAAAQWLWVGAGAAFLLDAVDGWVARQTRSASPFGADLDMELDGLTVIGLGLLVVWLGRAGWWAVLPGLFRYAFLAGMVVLPWMRRPLYDTPRRAWMCGVQLTLVIMALLPWDPPWVATALVATGALALGGSFLADVKWLHARR